ncbi:MAG: hypothetical protein KBC33_02935 [Candidatus Pacebacteria bacterium]|nr:hypothetical protein [Candidatus Paceibacterota bacterium]
MHTLKRTIANLLGRKLVRKWRLGRILTRREEARSLRRKKKAQEEHRAIERILSFPIETLKLSELQLLKKADEIDLNNCELGTWFICRPFAPLPNVIVLGHIVKGEEAIMSQFGGRTCIPERWINRYRVKLV